jgi:hypothetical protein
MARVVSIDDSKRIDSEFGVDSEGTVVQPGAVPRPPFDPEAKYTARRGPRFELVREEIDILLTLTEAVEERAPSGASEEEKQAVAEELFREDAELGRLWERLHELVRSNDESVVLALEPLEREEEDEEDAGP